MALLGQPDRVGVAADEFVHWEAFDGWFPPDALLLTVDEDDHRLRLAAAFGRPLG